MEETLPVESVEEYFEHFPILDIDYTFYSPLLDRDGNPTRNYHVLKSYCQHMKEKDRMVLKVPQMISAQKVGRGAKYIDNETYLNAEIFSKGFYEPAVEILNSKNPGNSGVGFFISRYKEFGAFSVFPMCFPHLPTA